MAAGAVKFTSSHVDIEYFISSTSSKLFVFFKILFLKKILLNYTTQNFFFRKNFVVKSSEILFLGKRRWNRTHKIDFFRGKSAQSILTDFSVRFGFTEFFNRDRTEPDRSHPYTRGNLEIILMIITILLLLIIMYQMLSGGKGDFSLL